MKRKTKKKIIGIVNKAAAAYIAVSLVSQPMLVKALVKAKKQLKEAAAALQEPVDIPEDLDYEILEEKV